MPVRRITSIALLLSVTTLAVLGASVASADSVAYDNLTGSTQANGGDNAPTYTNNGVTDYYTFAQEITSAASGYIDKLTLNLSDLSGSTPLNAGIGVYSNNGGKVGALLETLSVTTSGNFGTYATGSFTSGASLAAGTSYWLAPVTSSGNVVWWFSNTPSAPTEGQYLYEAGTTPGLNFTSGTYYESATPQAGLTVNVSSPVPLPSTALLLLSSLGGLSIVFLRRPTVAFGPA